MKRAFTLIELLVAILVLLAVLLAAGRIFSATSEVAGIGEALNDNQSDLNAIERQLRQDMAAISKEGFLAIRCVSVRNDCRLATNPAGGYLDPSLPPDAILRADHMVFFKYGFEGTQNYLYGEGGNKQGEGPISRIYFGHGYQLGPVRRQPDGSGLATVYDVSPNQGGQFGPIGPWMDRGLLGGNRPMIRQNMGLPQTGFTNAPANFSVPLPAFPAEQWLLCRQAVFMADDDYGFTSANPTQNAADPYFYLRGGGAYNGNSNPYSGGVIQSPSIFLRGFDPAGFGGFSPATNASVITGRVDSSSMEIDDMRRGISEFADFFDGGDVDGAPDNRQQHWNAASAYLQRYGLFYPHAERATSNMGRFSLPPTRHVISGACSDVRIEWTWPSGAGQIDLDGDGQPDDADDDGFLDPFEVGFRHSGRTPWFPFMNPAGEFGGLALQQYTTPDNEDSWFWNWEPEFADTLPLVGNVERFPDPGSQNFSGATAIYESTFGFNRTEVAEGVPGDYDYVGDATPWPSAIRVSIRVHDRAGRLTGGRQAQFVIDLPKE